MGRGADNHNIHFKGNRDSGEVQVEILAGAVPIASIKLSLQQATDFTVKLARCLDELSRAQGKPKLIVPESVLSR